MSNQEGRRALKAPGRKFLRCDSDGGELGRELIKSRWLYQRLVMSALKRVADSSRTSREVREGPILLQNWLEGRGEA